MRRLRWRVMWCCRWRPVLPRTLGRQGLRAGAAAAMRELQALHQAKQAALARGADGLVGADAAPVGGGGPVGGAAQPDPDRVVDTSPGKGGDFDVEYKILRAALRAFKEGDVAGAKRCAQSCARVVLVLRGQPAFATLVALFPPVRAEAEPLRARPHVPPPVIDEATVLVMLAGANMRSVGGPSGMTFKLRAWMIYFTNLLFSTFLLFLLKK